MRFFRAPLALLVFLFFSPSDLPASGLAVQPATFLFRDIPIGQKVKLSVPLSIHNKDERIHTYTIKSLAPSRLGMSRPEGYVEIPNTDWFSFDETEVTIAGGKMGSTNMYIEIPGEDTYYNQKWVIAVEVTTRVGTDESIALAVYPRFLIESENRETITGRPSGKTGIRPGKLSLSFEPKKNKSYIEIYNNDTISHTYIIRPFIPVSDVKQSLLQSPSPSYDWIPNIKWIVTSSDKVKIKAGMSRKIGINLAIPDNIFVNPQKWETLLFVTPDNGSPVFVRVYIEP